MPQGNHAERVALDHRRVSPTGVLRNLQTMRRRADVNADVALLAGYIDQLDDPPGGEPGELMVTALLALGDEYAAGFRDGFNFESTSRRASRRYLEGLEDGGAVGRLLRRRSH